MKISTEYGLQIVKAFEGCLKPDGKGNYLPYICPAGELTQGWGHTNLGGIPPRVVKGVAWSQTQCDIALANDMVKFEARVNRIMAGVPLKQHEFDALVSMDFNTGGLDRSSIPAKIRAGRRSEVPETLARWNKADGRVLAGLTRRRKAEGELFAGKFDTALRTAGTTRGPGTEGTMAQRVDKPTVPPAEVAKRSTAEVAVAAGGGGAAATKDNTGLGTAGIVIGAALILVAVGLVIRKWASMNADYA